MGLFSILADCLFALVLVAFMLLAYRDLKMLFTRPPGMSTGLWRGWAVGRVVVLEAWSNRVWTLPIIWFCVCLVLNLLIRVYNPIERIQLYISILLHGQELLVLFYMAMLAVVSLPRERERRTIITTGSKPLSRLELFLGKIFGLAAVTAGLLLAMGAGTWIFMNVADLRVREKAAADYALEKKDYDATVRKTKPSKALAMVEKNGLLQAQNYVVARHNFRIAGLIKYTKHSARRALRGGSGETLHFYFPSLPATVLEKPFFEFRFLPLIVAGFKPPIKLNVTLSLRRNIMKSEQGTVSMRSDGTFIWIPPHPLSYFTYEDPRTKRVYNRGPLSVRVACPTKGCFLVFNNRNSIQFAPALAGNLDAARVKGNRPFLTAAANPVITGFLAHGKEQIVGPSAKHPDIPPEVASYAFKHVQKDHIPLDKRGRFTIDIVASVDKQSHEQLPARASVEVYDINNPRDRYEALHYIDEKRITPVTIPGRFLKPGGMVINLRSAQPGQWLGLDTNSVRIVLPGSSFILNLFKSEMVIFLEAVLLIVIGVTAGIRLGWPVAALVTVCAFILGNLFNFISLLFHANGFNIYSYVLSARLKGVWWFELGSFFSNVLSKGMYLLVHLLPNFTRFAPLHYIAQSRDMPWRVVGIDFLFTLLFMAPAIALGYLFIRRQELA